MKSFKLTRIAILALSIALLIVAAVGISVSADSESNYDIIAMNISYGDRTQVLLAIDTPVENAANVAVTYSYGGKTYDAKYYPELTYTEEGVEYPVFYTSGISAKDVGEDIVAEAHNKNATEYTPSYKSVSVVKYLYRMLYREGYINATEAINVHKRELYQAMLTYVAKAQVSLWNDKNGDDAQRIPVTDRIYAYAPEATINGADSDVILDKAGSVTLAYTGSASGVVGWTVATYDAQGNKTEKVVTGNTLSLTESCVITPYVDPYLITFDDLAVGSYPAGSLGTSQIAQNGGSTVDIVEKDGSNALQIGTSGIWMYPVAVTEDGQTANATVIEMDVNYTNFDAANTIGFRDSTGSGSFYSSLMFNGNRIRFHKGGAEIKFDSADASSYYPMGTKTGTTFKLRIEYIWSVTEGNETVGKMNIYIDGTQIYSVSVDAIDGCKRLSIYSGSPNVFTMDNVKCINTYVEYKTN